MALNIPFVLMCH